MTNEEKQLLLKDLCARIPYVVIVELRGTYEDGEKYIRDAEFDGPMLSYLYYDETSIKPYLRPMSSMTEEEMYEYNTAIDKDVAPEQFVDWYNLHHFDYRGLIEKGLAIKAPKGMYKSEKPFKIGDKVIIPNGQKGIITRISAGKARVEMGDTMRIVPLSDLKLESDSKFIRISVGEAKVEISDLKKED